MLVRIAYKGVYRMSGGVGWLGWEVANTPGWDTYRAAMMPKQWPIMPRW